MFIVLALTGESFSEVSRHDIEADAIAACPPGGRVERQDDGQSVIIHQG